MPALHENVLMGIRFDLFHLRRCSPLPPWSSGFKEQNRERDERWKEKHLKKTHRLKRAMWHMEVITGLDSHLCRQSWPAGTQQSLRRMGIIQERIRGIVIRGVRIPWGQDFSVGGEGRQGPRFDGVIVRCKRFLLVFVGNRCPGSSVGFTRV